LEAAEAVCDGDLDTLQSLVEKSLLRFTNERYWMLETIRDEQRAMHGDINKLTTSHDNLTAEVRISNAHVAALVQSEVHTHQRLAEVEARVDRIERRLQLVGPARE
jgi:two-component sensor histidine kinase